MPFCAALRDASAQGLDRGKAVRSSMARIFSEFKEKILEHLESRLSGGDDADESGLSMGSANMIILPQLEGHRPLLSAPQGAKIEADGARDLLSEEREISLNSSQDEGFSVAALTGPLPSTETHSALQKIAEKDAGFHNDNREDRGDNPEKIERNRLRQRPSSADWLGRVAGALCSTADAIKQRRTRSLRENLTEKCVGSLALKSANHFAREQRKKKKEKQIKKRSKRKEGEGQ